jgi:hypothetical protein
MPPLRALAAPEVFEATAEFVTPQGDDGINTAHGPVHAGPLQARPDNHLTSCFQDPRGGAEALRMKFWVAHALSIERAARNTSIYERGGDCLYALFSGWTRT